VPKWRYFHKNFGERYFYINLSKTVQFTTKTSAIKICCQNISLDGDRKYCDDAKWKKHGFSFTVSNVFALDGRHLAFAPAGHAFDHSSQQSRSIISMKINYSLIFMRFSNVSLIRNTAVWQGLVLDQVRLYLHQPASNTHNCEFDNSLSLKIKPRGSRTLSPNSLIPLWRSRRIPIKFSLRLRCV
jgi:hypothetical protein